MRRKLAAVVFGLLFLTGFGILVYPTVSDQWNTYRQSQLISEYQAVLRQMEAGDGFEDAWEAARNYNDSFGQNNIYGDAFGSTEEEDREGNSQEALAATPYGQVLNVAGNGVMGYMEIPKINVRLAIYHGTAEDVLQTGVGHLYGTKLPIGGDSTHSVLSAHRGLPSARLFTDIDQLVQGDMFYLTVLDETLAYSVDQILPMVDKDDRAALEEALRIEEGEDLVTLFTCTPYGVNSHRLLVRGHRVPYTGELEAAQTPVDTMLKSVQNYYMLYMLFGLAVTALAILVLRYVILRPRGRRKVQDPKGIDGRRE